MWGNAQLAEPNEAVPVQVRPRLHVLPGGHEDEEPQDVLSPMVDAAMAGDQRALDGLITQIRPLVIRYCRSRLGRVEHAYGAADDVAQEVCIAVCKALPTYRKLGRPFLSFVYGIAAHKVADARRAAARDRTEPTDQSLDRICAEAGPELLAEREDSAQQLAGVLTVLTDKQREILLLRVVLGQSAEEAAEVMGSTPGAVRVAQHRALSRLRKILATQR
ncbi:RNA polymerase sigma factor ShbA [Labedaea rhizosphaerae]|uniref:RNA polymerase RpoE-like sigma-24 subunit n=1 Tax=Labedaea rhizosphaerae TaxID=598644 RepID=A0A4R6SMB9_LABRH|nr:RNA polymerase sigma factor ShbA [Labedaea rhizosphaerae]TDQ05031.1 RNA polymerase RpoE-like sigma-24 subunit [Labedaea rhizosphaerae]